LIRLLGVLALVFGLTSVALAAAAAKDDTGFAGAVPGLAGKTWVEILSQIFPDIVVTERGYASATEVIDLRSIGPGDDSWVKCGDEIKFLDRDARPVRLSGQDYVIVTVTIEDDCVGPIGLFDAAGKLVDAVNIRGDQHVSFSGDYVRPLGSDAALVTASVWHDNSGQSYDITSLVLAKPGGFSVIGEVLAFGSRDCRSQFTEEAKIDPAPGTGPMLWIDGAVTRRAQRLAADCETKTGPESKTTFSGYWRWNAKKSAYEPHTRELDLLDKWNEKRF
jgi:hypothetical protein